MRVVDSFYIKGRGFVASVEGAPPTGCSAHGVMPGVLVHQGEHAWRVRGVESFGGRPQTRLGLLLVAIGDAPDVPEKGELEL